MIQFFKNINQQTVEVDKSDIGVWVNILPPLKQEEFHDLSEDLDIPLDFLTDSLDIDERSRFEEYDNVKLMVIISFPMILPNSNIKNHLSKDKWFK